MLKFSSNDISYLNYICYNTHKFIKWRCYNNMKKKVLIIGAILLAIVIGVLLFLMYFNLINNINENNYSRKNKINTSFNESNENKIISGLNDNEINENNITNIQSQDDEKVYNKEFGSYAVLSSWEENEEHSTDNKFFYVLSGTENEATPNNISINAGTNKYDSANHMKFKDAILKQLSSQIKASGKQGVKVNGGGSYTDNGYILYTFTIYEEEQDITTTQYYIVGDYKYVLIHETTFGNSEETDTVAKRMVNSFEWT